MNSNNHYEPCRTAVTCPKCKARILTNKVEIKDVSESIEGWDTATFDCPECKAENVQAYVYGF